MKFDDIQPLLFSASVRNIPAVLELWEELPFDHLVEKYKMPLDAYQDAKKFFMQNKGYTHIFVMADDLEVRPKDVIQLMKDIDKFSYPVIGGMCNIDESQKTVYNIQPWGCNYKQDFPQVSKGSWFSETENPILPDKDIFKVGFNGFALLAIERSIVEQCSFSGSSNEGQSNMDWQLNRECAKLGVDVMTDKRVNMYHRRMEQHNEARAFKNKCVHVNESHEFLKTAKSKGF